MSSVTALSMASWPMPRKVAAAMFGIVCIVGLTCAAIYLSAVLFLLLNKADPSQARFGSITHYWALYADDPRLRKSLVGSMVVSGVGLLILLPAALISAARPRRALHGDARFASGAEVERAGLTGSVGSSPSILVGRYGKRFLALPGQLSVMLSAPTRSGKGVGVVIPNLLNWPDSVVVLDIKGENFDVTAGYRAAHGQALGSGEVGQLLPHPLVAIDGADGVAAHHQFLRSALAKRLQRQRAGPIGVERIHDRLLVDGSHGGHRGGRSWKRYAQSGWPTS